MPSFSRSAFTLTEILIVIALIVLFITLALPAFNLISGGRSIAGGTNEISAFLGRARAEALGSQQIRGVGFYFNASTGRSTMCIVHQPFQETPSSLVPYSTTYVYPLGSYAMNVTGTPAVTSYYVYDGITATPRQTDQYVIDAETDKDVLPMPTGVGVQLVNNCAVSAGVRSTNGYVSFGAILFDQNGNLSSRPISIAEYGIIGTAANLQALNVGLPNGFVTGTTSMPAIGAGTLSAQFGAVMFDLSAFQNAAGGTMTPQSVWRPGASYTESSQETWLDHNATPLLINRYNGTLIKAQ